ncbi:MAG: DUF2326 domain-containing protein [Clostridiaceae bacterium]|nr:DUF2326 domain-containing protein [Clostridiaceae bacterium]
MLIEILCDKFLDHGRPRGRIPVHSGLNVVLGSDSGSNSIGKSTFLMIIDFIFGGTDYIDRLTDVQTEVGVHTIFFTFAFENGLYHFGRSTGEYNKVYRCNSDYDILEGKDLSLDDYTEFLSREYKLNLPGLTLRNAIGRFIRVYKRETLDEEHPLHQAKQETAKVAIEGLLKILDLYSGIAEQSKIAKDAKDRYATFRNAQKYQYIPFVRNQTEFNNNEKRLVELAFQAEDLVRKSSGGLLDLDSVQAEQLSLLQNSLSNYKRQRSRLISQLRAIRTDKELGQKKFKRNYEALQRFFPNVDLLRIDAIEEFHKQLAGILKDEFSEAEDNLRATVDLIDTEMTTIETNIAKIGAVTDLSKAVLEQYASIDKELKTLRAANDNCVETEKLTETAKAYEESLNNLVREQISFMQQAINAEMVIINNAIYDGKKTAPSLLISDASHYSFFTPRDGGTGSQYKGLVVFDLAMLNITNLPLLVHDSVMLKHIADEAIERILLLYSKTPKQVFIAMDKEGSYTEEAQKIMEKTKILQLSIGEGALFGRTWNDI